MGAIHRAVAPGLQHLLPYLSDREGLAARWRRSLATFASMRPGWTGHRRGTGVRAL